MQMFDLDARTIASLRIPLELGGITHIDGLHTSSRTELHTTYPISITYIKYVVHGVRSSNELVEVFLCDVAGCRPPSSGCLLAVSYTHLTLPTKSTV